MPKVSVVVPVYKVEKYLDECVQSICDSTLQDIEILLIDDGSPDNCGQKCEDWAERDKRIRVFHKTNGGLSDARNYGIDRANGDYIAFVDSDDKIAPEMLQKLYNVCEKYKTKVAICSVYKWFSDGRTEKIPDLDTLCSLSFIDYKELSGMYHNVAWRKLYHKSIFANPHNRFPFGILHEDIGFWWIVMAQIDTIAVVKEPLIYYRQDNPSSINQKEKARRKLNDSARSFHFGYFNGIKLVSPQKKEQYQTAFLNTYIKMIYFGNFDNDVRRKHYKLLQSLKPVALKQNAYVRNMVLHNLPFGLPIIKINLFKNILKRSRTLTLQMFGVKILEFTIG